MAAIEIDISNQAIADAIGQTALAKLQNPQPLYKIWAARTEALMVEAFRNRKTPYRSAAWDPLRPITLNLDKLPGRRRISTLRQTGALYDSVFSAVVSDGVIAGTNQKVTSRSGTYSLGAIHQFGAIVPITPKSRAFFTYQFSQTKNQGWEDLANVGNDFVVIPARPFMPVDDQGNFYPEYIDDLRNLTLRWLLS